MKKGKKLSLKKITVLSLDDANLIRGGDECDTCAFDGESYCGGCPTRTEGENPPCGETRTPECNNPTTKEDNCPSNNNPSSCTECNTHESTCPISCLPGPPGGC